MRNILLLTTALLLCTLGQLFAQKQDTVFYDRNWNVTSKKLAGYYRLETKIKTEDTLYWEFEDRFIENDQVQNKGYLLKKNPELRHGHWIWYYANGNKEMEGDYKKNERLGIWYFYHNDGSLKKLGEYSTKGKQNGEWNWYHPDSSLMGKATYKLDTLIGKRVWYHPNGVMKFEEFYKKGKLDSTRTEWFSTGKVKLISPYSNGFKNGLEKEWYLDGGLKSEINYFSGLPEDEIWFSMNGDTVPKDSVVNEKEFHNLLWKISGNGLKKPSYLFGTMHIKDKDAFEFSDSMLLAFNRAEGYSMEIHPDSLYAYYFKQFDKYKTWLHFGAEVFGVENQEDYFMNWGESYSAYSNWVMNLNEIFHRDEYNPEGMPYFVDCYLYYIATKQGKFTDGIERVEDHVNAGKNLPQNTMRYDILSTFDAEEEMLLTYKEGNLDKINALMEFLQNEEFRYRLLTVRNIKMAEAIDSLAKIRSTFNTAGTAHLPGKDGVIELLRQKGYTLTPIKSVFSGDTLDAQVNKLNPSWRTQRPFNADFTVESPGPLTAFSAGLVRNVFLDPIREIGVDAYQLDERWFTSGKKSSKIERSDINYLFNYPSLDEKISITHDGVKGLEIRWKEVEEDYYGIRKSMGKEQEEKALYYRARVFKKDFQTMVVLVASSKKDSLNGDYALKFLNSMAWDKQVKTEPNWNTVIDSIGAFSVQAPENAKYHFIHYNPKDEDADEDSYYYNEPEEHKIHYYVSEEKNNKFIFRYNNSPIGDWFFNDKEIFQNGLNYYLSFLDKITDSSHYTLEDYPVMGVKVKANKKHLVYFKFVNRGYRNYLLIAQIDKSSKSKEKAKAFFESFKLLPLGQIESKMYYTEKDSVGFYIPQEKDSDELNSFRFFVPNRTAYGSKKSYDSYEEDYDWETWIVEAIPNNDDEKRDIGAYNNRNKFYALDSLSGVTYQAYVETFSEYFSIENRDSLFSYYEDIFKGDSYIVDSSYRDSSMTKIPSYWNHFNFTRKEQNGFGQLRFTQVGQTIVSQRVFYPKEMIGNANIEAFFSKLDLSKIKDSVNIFEDKSQKILSGLLAKDSLLQVYSREALLFYPFDSSHVAEIQKYAILEADLDTNDFENNSMDLIQLLTDVNDSTTAPFVYDFYHKYFRDSLEARINLISIIHELDDSLGYLAVLDFVKDSIQDFDKNKRKYLEVLEYFEDSLGIFAKNFETFEPYLNDSIWDLKTEIYKLANTCFKKDSMNTKGIIARKDFLLDKYFQVAQLYKGLTKDSTEYINVKTNLKEFTDLIGYLKIDNDSLQAVMFRLLDDRDKKLRFSATKVLFRSENALNDSEKEKMFKDIKNRYKLMQVLSDIEAVDRIPEQYKTQEIIAESQLYFALTNSSKELYSASRPVKIKLLKIVNETLDDEAVRFYVYSYYDEKFGREKKIAVSNPQPKDKTKFNFYSEPTYSSNDYYGSEKKQIKNIVEQWKIENEDGSNTILETAESIEDVIEIIDTKLK